MLLSWTLLPGVGRSRSSCWNSRSSGSSSSSRNLALVSRASAFIDPLDKDLAAGLAAIKHGAEMSNPVAEKEAGW